jgi:hypothetical protein
MKTMATKIQMKRKNREAQNTHLTPWVLCATLCTLNYELARTTDINNCQHMRTPRVPLMQEEGRSSGAKITGWMSSKDGAKF